jgi:predicted O-methyltransferase YrrM
VLPPAVAWYLLRARLLAERRDEDWARFSSLPAASLARLLDLAGGARNVVELGTAMGWTTGALVLARPDRTVTSYDVVRYDGRAHYLGLLAESARARIELVTAPGASGPPGGARPVDLVFVDASHDRVQTAAEFSAWRPAVAPGGLVAFHDYRNPDFPGVAEAIDDDLGLAGEVVGDMFVWRHRPATGP